MQTPAISMIVSDLDGTLLCDHETIHPDNLRAIQRAISLGIRFVVATGRSLSSCRRLLARHGIEDAHIIAVNGCQTAELHSDALLDAHYLETDAGIASLAIYAKYGLHGCLYTENSTVYPTEEAMCAISSHQMSNCGPAALAAALSKKLLKTFCIRRDGQEEAFACARAECAALPNVEITSSWHDNFEVMPYGVDKGHAVLRLAKMLGIGKERIAAFGDSENDLSMLTVVGYGYAMANASDVVRKAVDRYTGSNADGGVAMALEGLL